MAFLHLRLQVFLYTSNPFFLDNIFLETYQNTGSIVNLKDIERFDNGTHVNPEKLMEVGLVRKVLDGVKVLGDGEIAKPLTVSAHKFSKVAIEKIKAAGGEIKVLS